MEKKVQPSFAPALPLPGCASPSLPDVQGAGFDWGRRGVKKRLIL